ncbi:MAG: histidinol-phosphate aminotransferase family protein [Acidimicrobiaceae bacterium]|nr:histidinol-phosphate aminotransferase family protein [Acidimicrobiaceae bacterium]MYD07190.1 histidinol-phosphate aminotransferase family protein [Acidimicrobiaceae bacterium]MYI59462.1 histidinol-phosphate aminotransferase family protein [Acidimicrobiaceae bacterium]
MAVHGGLDEAELHTFGLDPTAVLDFSSNLNPLGPSEAVLRAAAAADITSYPDPRSTQLREALAAQSDVRPDQVLVGNGATELIHLLVQAYLGPDLCCVILEPTFGEYRAAAEMAGSTVVPIRATAENKFRWNIATAAQTFRDRCPSLVFLCNPNNPTGRYLDLPEVEELADAIPKQGLLVLDDAYAHFAEQAWDACSLLERNNIVVLRSLTKAHALAGVRLGCLIAPKSVVAAVERRQHSWSVNAVAQTAGLAAVKDEVHVNRARCAVRESRDYLSHELRRLGLTPEPSVANFLLVDVCNASVVRKALLQQQIVVRDCASFGLPQHIRIAVRQRHECEQLITALAEVMSP